MREISKTFDIFTLFAGYLLRDKSRMNLATKISSEGVYLDKQVFNAS